MRIALATVGTTGDIRPFLVLGRALPSITAAASRSAVKPFAATGGGATR